jgi:hypothetical protein
MFKVHFSHKDIYNNKHDLLGGTINTMGFSFVTLSDPINLSEN